ncbi:zinc transporter, ZIP family [Oryzisolibacter propanilivorax]|uniref:Zinc transporter, ZIP family n=1 Tax=Oryzisolibacter propanilivorax TaxID=1527607 RepID=A0A1G9PEC2_9BURK|nr:ZIP family metal transporter [Oryzisolibacter propanilivorax]SDL97054.1 zinc transporter, ZIP family [Oryzisolibacter propanilivorax]
MDSLPSSVPRVATLQAAPALRWRWRHLVGLAIALAALVIWGRELLQAPWLREPAVAGALTGGAMAALATALGTLPVLLSHSFSQRSHDTMLGFGAGVMLAASAFSLIIPALAAARGQGAGGWGAAGIVGAGITAGGLLLLLIDRVVPHEHFVKGLEGPQARAMKRVWLFVLAIAVHNLPEGLAIGVAYAGTDALGALALATGISIQDVPEGLVVALALRGVGYGRGRSAALGALSGLVEPVAAVFGAALIGVSASLLPWGLAAAAGAMLYVISHEIIPESHRAGHERWATCGLMLGFVLMMVLDTALA